MTESFNWDKSISVDDETKAQIKNEIYRAKIEIKRAEQDKEKVEEKRRDLKEVKHLRKLFNKHITEWDYAAGEELKNTEKCLMSAKAAINTNIQSIESFIEEHKQDIRTSVFIIKRICLENVSQILFGAGIKAFKNKSGHILSLNDIDITDKKKHTSYAKGFYSQQDIQWFVKKLKPKNLLKK